MMNGIVTPTMPICRSIRDAKMTREKTSWPSWSVPNRCVQLGPCSPVARSCSSGAYGAISGANTATRQISTTPATPILRDQPGLDAKRQAARAPLAGRLTA